MGEMEKPEDSTSNQAQIVTTGPATERDTAMPVSIAMRTRMMLHWAQIAVEQEHLARRARRELERQHAADESPSLRKELRPAMIAVAASAHALDALYAELAELVGPETLATWETSRRGGRWAEIAAILELSFVVDVDPWRPRLKTLFVERRNPVVHPKANLKPVVKHPALPSNVAAEYVTYSVESAQESLDLLLEILSTCAESPRPALEEWAKDARRPIEELSDVRGALLQRVTPQTTSSHAPAES
jgi:hypothetical protein